MRDEFLFVVAPFLAVCSFLLGSLVRYGLRHRQREAGGEPSSRVAAGVAAVWGGAIATVAVGHLLGFAFPEHILLWNRQPLRLFALEGAGVLAGTVALLGAIAAGARRLRAADRLDTISPLDVIAWTLVGIEVVSGIAIAVLYRWASSWSGVTLTPYLVSLFRLAPLVTLVAGMPFLVRLHVFCAFAVVGVAPFTRPARVVFASLSSRTGGAAARAAAVFVPALRALEIGRTKHVQLVQAAILQNEDREN
jgi:nitrate reductase gamma subunit